MKTVITKEVDGKNIITNISDAGGFIDPVKTNKIVEKEIQKSEIFKQIKQIHKQMSIYAQQAMQARQAVKESASPNDKKKFHDEFLFRSRQIKELETDLPPLFSKLKLERKELVKKHAVYFPMIQKPGIDEKIITDEQCEEIKEKLQQAYSDGKLLDKDLNFVEDNRGKTFYKKIGGKWERFSTHKIGVPVPSGFTSKPTDDEVSEIVDQENTERVKKLSGQAKAAEKENALQGAVARAGMMKNELEVQGDAKALKKAQDWLEAEKVKLNMIYG